MKKILFGVLACALLVIGVHAQQNTGEIIGTVLLADGTALPGVNVTLTGNVTGKTTVVSSDNGNYRFLKLAPGNYNLVFELEGFKNITRQDLRVNVGATMTLNVVMEPGTVQEKVLVIGQSPMISTRKSTISTTVTRTDMDLLPLGRGYLTVINMTPGVLSESQGGGVTGGSGLFYGPGTEAQKNSWAVDGASTDGRFYPGEMGASISKNQLEETQVSVSSHDIMNVAGGVSVNFVSKRGGNRVSGNVFVELMDKKFERNQTLPDYMKSLGWVPSGVERIWDYAASIGGPFWKDHLWYFASASISDPMTRSSTNSISRPNFSGNYYFKVNAQYKNTTAQFSYNWSGSDSAITPISNYTTATQKQTSPSTFYTAELQHVMGKLLLTGKYTFSKTAYSLHSADAGWTGGATYNDGRHIRFPGRAWTYNYAQSAPKSALPPISMMLAQDEVGRRPYFVAYADYFAEKLFGGDHEFKVGVDFANNKMNREQLLPNQMCIFVNSIDANFTWPDGTKPGVAKRFYFRDDIVGARYTKRESVFFQDTATYKKLTVNFGLRWDKNSWGWQDVWMGPMLPWNAGASNGDWAPWCIEMNVKAGKVPVSPSALSPRLSLSYDLTGNGKNVIKASIANYTGVLSNRMNEAIAPGAGRVIYAPFFDYDNDNWPDEGEFYRYPLSKYLEIQAAKTAPGWAYYTFSGLSATSAPSAAESTNIYDPDWKTPRVQEIVIGFEKQFTQDIAVSLNGYHKKETDQMATYRYVGTKDNYTVQWPWEVTFSKVATDTVTGNDVYVANPRAASQGNFFSYDRNNWTYYYGLEFQFHKRLSHNWMANFSFNYQDYKWHMAQNEMTPENYRYFNDAASDPASYRSGLIFFNARWMVKANGLYKLPLGFTLSGTLVANEGNPVWDGRSIVSGQTMYDPKGKYGDLRMPNVVQVNLGLEKEFPLSEGMSVTLAALYYNVFNNTTVIRVGQQMVPQVMRPDRVTEPGIMQLGIRVNWR